MRPLFYSDQDCRDRLKPGKPMFFNVYRGKGGLFVGTGLLDRHVSHQAAFSSFGGKSVPPYRIVVKAKPTPSPEKEDAA